MTMTTIAPAEDVHAERWRLWQLANAASNHKTMRHARIAFTLILTVIVAALARQLLGF